MMSWKMLSFQDSTSTNMENLILLHDFSMMVMILIMMLITMNMIYLNFNKFYNFKLLNNQYLEMMWTLLPMLILFTVAMPALIHLYNIEETNKYMFTMKIISHQWYWSIEYSDFNNKLYNSFMSKNSMNMNMFRIMDTDTRMILPFNVNIRLLITSMDVIHSFSMPSMGLKVDSCPGRLNQINLMSLRPGLFFGQCSEICGINHSFMPIVIEFTSLTNMINYLKN
uniref:Cytochrome c oxidase subunit 2 n=1 Tax=Diapriidae sp. ZJUH_2016010 TaxID=2491155 RepID=A0A3S8V0K1_9HYME|nr:cytochrome c oxidase subunit 2 [Diapriidae sp. ZJUH_2016010]